MDGTPLLRNRERPRECDWPSIRLAVHSGATSTGRKTMTTPKAKLAGLALVSALCAGFTLGLTAPACAGWDEGLAAYQRGDYATALREIRPLAEQGDDQAQYYLGSMYHYGQGVPQGYAEAVKLYRKAAEQGYANAQNTLGFMYASGRGVPQDDAEAMEWYRKAAEQGYAPAQYNIGFLYRKGRGVPQDYAEAMKWYRKAAEQGHAKAQLFLGNMYGNGQGVPRDDVQAYMWFKLASSTFPPGKGHDLAVKNRDIVAEKMTPAQISDAERLAREWKPK